MKQPIQLKDALKRMRELTQANVPFSIGFIPYNATKQEAKPYKVVKTVLLRKGYRKDKSKKANVLIAYTDELTNQSRQFYLPLLLMFNGHKVTP